MSLGTPTAIGTRVLAATSSIGLTTTGAVPAGATAVFVYGSSLANNLTGGAVSDNSGLGLTWLQAEISQGPTTANVTIWYVYCPAGLPSGSVITGTFATATNTTKIAHGLYFTGQGTPDKSNVGNRSTNGTTWATSATAATTAATAAIGAAFFGAAAANSDQTGSTPAFTELSDTSGSSRGMVTTYATAVTSGTAVVAAGTIASSTSFAAAVVAFKEVGGGTTETLTAGDATADASAPAAVAGHTVGAATSDAAAPAALAATPAGDSTADAAGVAAIVQVGPGDATADGTQVGAGQGEPVSPGDATADAPEVVASITASQATGDAVADGPGLFSAATLVYGDAVADGIVPVAVAPLDPGEAIADGTEPVGVVPVTAVGLIEGSVGVTAGMEGSGGLTGLIEHVGAVTSAIE